MTESPVESLDLLGDPLPRTRARPTLAEAAALAEVLRALRAHPRVAWAQRMNSGAIRAGTRYIRFGFPGCPDVLGQLTNGGLLACEVKGPGGKLRPEQRIFLAQVRAAGGVAFIARSLVDVVKHLGPLEGAVPARSGRAGTGTSASRSGLIEQVGAGAAR
jgi:hypothetical protein